MCAEMSPTLWTLTIAADKHPDCALLVTCASDLAQLGINTLNDVSAADEASVTGSLYVFVSFQAVLDSQADNRLDELNSAR